MHYAKTPTHMSAIWSGRNSLDFESIKWYFTNKNNSYYAPFRICAIISAFNTATYLIGNIYYTDSFKSFILSKHGNSVCLFRRHMLSHYYDDMTPVFFDNDEMSHLGRMAIGWLMRVEISAVRIQRAYRRHRNVLKLLREARYKERIAMWVPQLVLLLKR